VQTHYTIKHTHACRHAHTNTCTENNYSDMNHYTEIIVMEAYCQLWKLVVERCQECPLPVIGPGWESWHADDVLLGLITNFCSFTQFFDGIAKTKSKFLFGLEVNVHKSKDMLWIFGLVWTSIWSEFVSWGQLTTLTTVGLADRSWTQLWRFELFCVYARANLTLVSQCVCVHQFVVLVLSFFLLHNSQ